MNKQVLKKVAVNARIELIRQVELRAGQFGVTARQVGAMESGADHVLIHGTAYPRSYATAYQTLVNEWQNIGFTELAEKVAYTWFNRFLALRFMEVNGYLPSQIRVLSSEVAGNVDPDILTHYQETGLPVDPAAVQAELDKGNREGAYRLLLIAQCNELHEIMPFLFEKIDDYTELLLPSNLLHADSVISRLVQEIDEADLEKVEVIGWMYQYYVAERKDEVFAALKKNQKIGKESIPAATQLFTPEWIVKYMVENSVGRLWSESHPESSAKENWRYYIEPAEQEPDAAAQLNALVNPNLRPEDITVMDPACGSGHILVYAFDLLYDLYQQYGYSEREIPTLILEQNLYGIDVDDRAAQLAAFALMMKARARSRRIFRNPPQLNILSIQESNGLDALGIAELLGDGDGEQVRHLHDLLTLFEDAKNYGSLLHPDAIDYDAVQRKIAELREENVTSLFDVENFAALDRVEQLVAQGKLLAAQYDVVVTNPPYMGNSSMNPDLDRYVKMHYPTSKYDLFAVFMERNLELLRPHARQAMINQHSWMFLGRYEKLRRHLLEEVTLESMLHLGPRAFEEIGGEIVQSTAFVMRKVHVDPYRGSYHRLVPFDDSQAKEAAFLAGRQAYVSSSAHFRYMPGAPIAYWASEGVQERFRSLDRIGEHGEAREGMATAANGRFLREWHEVSRDSIALGCESREAAQASGRKWFPYNKGGVYQKWYGNLDYVVNWENDGYEIRHFTDDKGRVRSHNYNLDYIFRPGITWSALSSNLASFRYVPHGFLFDSKGSTFFPANEAELLPMLALLNAKTSDLFLSFISQNLDFKPGHIASVPYVQTTDERISEWAQDNIALAKSDWDSFENSWDFAMHPFCSYREKSGLLREIFLYWSEATTERYNRLKHNEEQINRAFIEQYGLQDELTPDVDDDTITIRLADAKREARSLLSYAVGCMMGRYSLDAPGLAFAGGSFDETTYKTFRPDRHGIIPITDQAYFEDDLILRLEEFLSVAFGADTVRENLQWLAESLTLKTNETPGERLRRYFMEDFYEDHCRLYDKRPIYWLFDSGKKKGFRALVYLHRYTPETLATLRLNYLQELQVKYEGEKRRLEQEGQAEAKRQLRALQLKQEELLQYDRWLADYANRRITLDLDDGVVVNYAHFMSPPLLAAIK